MKLPKKFKLKGKTWRIRFVDSIKDSGMDCLGICHCDRRLIEIVKGLPPKKLKATFLHELFHAVIFEAHINYGTKFGAGIEEVLCDAFEDALSTCFVLKFKRTI